MQSQTKQFHDDRYRSDILEAAELRVVNVHLNGSPAVAEYLLNGALVGRRHWDPDGYLTLETPFRDGHKHGVEYSWYGPDVLTLAEPYAAGLVHGTARQWDDDGTLLGTYTLVHGTGIDLWRARTAAGTIYLSEAFHLDRGRLHGFEWWLYDDQVSVYEERHWHAGVRHGIERKWKLDGSLHPGFPRYFINGELVAAKTYKQACAQDLTLPPCRVEDDQPGRNFPMEIASELGQFSEQKARL